MVDEQKTVEVEFESKARNECEGILTPALVQPQLYM